MSPFDYVKSITDTKKNIIDSEEMEKEYKPTIVNRAFSHFVDTIFIANEINKYHNLDKKLQYDYLFHAVQKKKRFAKWPKKLENEDLSLIMEYYKYSLVEAKSVLPLFTPNQLAVLRNKIEQGGVK